MDFETIILTKEDHIATLILNRPDKFNAINDVMIQELTLALKQVDDDDEVRVLVITGAGKAFCSGGEIKKSGVTTLQSTQGAEVTYPAMEIYQGINHIGSQVILALRNLKIPTIGMIDGVAAGGGFDFALACDIRIGSEKARFKIAFISIGLFPGTGGLWLLPRIVGVNKAAELMFTDQPIDAQQAEKLGILNKLVPSEKLQGEVMKMAHQIANGPPIALKLAKLLLYKGLHSDFAAALEDAAAHETITWASQDVKEGLQAFQEKRTPRFAGK